MNRKYNDMHILKLLEVDFKKKITDEQSEVDTINMVLEGYANDRKDCLKFLRTFGKHCRFDPYNYEDIIDPLNTRVFTLQNTIALQQLSIKFIKSKRNMKKRKLK